MGPGFEAFSWGAFDFNGQWQVGPWFWAGLERLEKNYEFLVS
jgi:hypothetical protein